ncbi:MAG: hypothetical protein HC892_22230 [Saprospiraceae bacterium]|nr:hypothetical protein [Saprospiraceae bacterium]
MSALPNTRMPGVITQEIPTLPPSIALVPSAVPVFIGYTEKAEKNAPNDLRNKATRVRNLDEYEKWFGTAPVQELDVEVDDRSALGEGFKVKVGTKANTTFYRMHYAMRMYYANGGGPCFIISIGSTPTVPPAAPAEKDLFIAGINAARKAKDITIIALPDAVTLSAADYNEVITTALKHCEKLINRVTLIDVTIPKENGEDIDQITTIFRSNMSSNINEKKYGIAYYPYLQTTLSYNFSDTSVILTKMLKNGQTLEQAIYQGIEAALTAEPAITVPDLKTKAQNAAKTYADSTTLPADLEAEFNNTNSETASIKTIAQRLATDSAAVVGTDKLITLHPPKTSSTIKSLTPFAMHLSKCRPVLLSLVSTSPMTFHKVYGMRLLMRALLV